MLHRTITIILFAVATIWLLVNPSLGAAVNKVYSDPSCQNLVAEYRTVKNYFPCPAVSCMPTGSQWVTFACSDELNSTFEGQPTVATFYSDISCNKIREMVALFSKDVTCINLVIGASFSVANNCYKNTEKSVVFGIYAEVDCALPNFGNVTTTQTCSKEGGTSDVVTCASLGPTDKPSTLTNVPIIVGDQPKENSARSTRALIFSALLILCIKLLVL